MKSDYLRSAIKQFEYYKLLGDNTFAQLDHYDLFWKYNVDSNNNNIATIVKHLWGNMLSRWTDFLSSDGEKLNRDRDDEFVDDIQSQEELLNKWEEGWECLFKALKSLKEEDLDKVIFIRNEGHTVVEAINRQLSHYPYHIGQIVYIGKMLQRKRWVSITIPKGESKSYNAGKFAQEPQRKHFTDEFLKKNE